MKTQEELDSIIRANKGKAAVEAMEENTKHMQVYKLSDGTFLVISKKTGKGHVEDADGNLLRSF